MSFIILIFHSNTISWSTHKIDKVQDNSSFNIDPFLLLTEDDGYGCHMRSHTQLRSATQPWIAKAENSASSFLPGSPAHFLLVFLPGFSAAALANISVFLCLVWKLL